MRRIVSVLALAALAVPLAFAAPAPMLHGNNFFSNCRFSHTASDDPIALPRLAGRSHAHTFFGNASTNAYSTLESLRKAGTTCKPAADKAAYWIPTLYQGGREIRPAKAQAYYVLRGIDQMHAFPAGLRMIAGNAHTTRPQSKAVVYWTCGGRAVRTAPSTMPPARCGIVRGLVQMLSPGGKPHRVELRSKSFLELHVNFPDCWDGKHLDSPDHQRHMAYSRDYVCPASHPVKVPLIRLTIRYPLTSGKNVALASGGQLTGHADFFNAWDEQALARLVDDCYHGRPCNERR